MNLSVERRKIERGISGTVAFIGRLASCFVLLVWVFLSQEQDVG